MFERPHLEHKKQGGRLWNWLEIHWKSQHFLSSYRGLQSLHFRKIPHYIHPWISNNQQKRRNKQLLPTQNPGTSRQDPESLGTIWLISWNCYSIMLIFNLLVVQLCPRIEGMLMCLSWNRFVTINGDSLTLNYSIIAPVITFEALYLVRLTNFIIT